MGVKEGEALLIKILPFPFLGKGDKGDRVNVPRRVGQIEEDIGGDDRIRTGE